MKFFSIPFVWVGEDDYRIAHVAIVEAETASDALKTWNDRVLDCTDDVWGKHVTEHYDTGSAELSGPGFAYVMRSCDCGDKGCFDADSNHDSISVAITWNAPAEAFHSLDAAKNGCHDSNPVVLAREGQS